MSSACISTSIGGAGRATSEAHCQNLYSLLLGKIVRRCTQGGALLPMGHAQQAALQESRRLSAKPILGLQRRRFAQNAVTRLMHVRRPAPEDLVGPCKMIGQCRLRSTAAACSMRQSQGAGIGAGWHAAHACWHCHMLTACRSLAKRGGAFCRWLTSRFAC